MTRIPTLGAVIFFALAAGEIVYFGWRLSAKVRAGVITAEVARRKLYRQKLLWIVLVAIWVAVSLGHFLEWF